MNFDIVPNGIVLPQRRYWPVEENRSAFDGGAFTAEGEFIEMSRHVGRAHRHMPGPLVPAAPELWSNSERLTGSWVYGGHLRNHFGHFVIECLGRMWAVDRRFHGRDVAGIVFFMFNGRPRSADRTFTDQQIATVAKSTARHGFIGEMIELLTGLSSWRVAGLPLQADELIVPKQIMGDGIPEAHNYDVQMFRNFMHERLAIRFGAPNRIEPVYVSRSRLPRQTGSPVLEDILEENLKQEGYRIIYPEQMSLTEQIKTYQNSGTILGISGSALHLAAFCLDENATLGLIVRMKAGHRKFIRQATDMGARAYDFSAFIGEIEPVRSEQNPPVNWTSSRHVLVLDIEKLWQQLHAKGLVSRPQPPIIPSRSVVEMKINASLQRMREEHAGLDFRFNAF